MEAAVQATEDQTSDKFDAAYEPPQQEISPERLEQLKQAYSVFDKDGDGEVTEREFAHVMKCLGQNHTEEEISAMFEQVDTDGSGMIDFEEFLDFLKIMETGSYKMGSGSKVENNYDLSISENWAYAFRIFDLDGDGFITPSELRQVLTNMGETLSEAEVCEMINEVDADGDGKLNMDEFVGVMMNGIPT
mmetsp:Transcript_31619/g.50483  ORF Transcript_31619/g.50483 Transcript_31619/m.50483 type:complete len:190 (-) Transcript_31619:573-1142(-)